MLLSHDGQAFEHARRALIFPEFFLNYGLHLTRCTLFDFQMSESHIPTINLDDTPSSPGGERDSLLDEPTSDDSVALDQEFDRVMGEILRGMPLASYVDEEHGREWEDLGDDDVMLDESFEEWESIFEDERRQNPYPEDVDSESSRSHDEGEDPDEGNLEGESELEAERPRKRVKRAGSRRGGVEKKKNPPKSKKGEDGPSKDKGKKEVSRLFSLSSSPSSYNKAHNEELRQLCGLDELKGLLVVPDRKEVANAPREKNTYLTTLAHVKSGLVFPLNPFVKRVLMMYNISPFQLSPNAIRTVLGMYSLFHIHNRGPLSPNVFSYFYNLVAAPGDPGFYSFRIRKDRGGVTGKQGNCGPWKYKWFRIKDEEGGIPEVVGEHLDVKSPSLTGKELEDAEYIVGLGAEARRMNNLCSFTQLKACGMIPASAKLIIGLGKAAAVDSDEEGKK